MAELSISLSKVQNIKTVKIEELGVFTVRRLGPGEEYDLSMKRRRLGKIGDEMMKIKKEIDALPDDESKEKHASKQLDKVNALSDEIAEIQKFELDMYKRCFIDDDNGKKTDILIGSLTADERMGLFNIIFNTDTKAVENE